MSEVNVKFYIGDDVSFACYKSSDYLQGDPVGEKWVDVVHLQMADSTNENRVFASVPFSQARDLAQTILSIVGKG